MSAVTFEQWTNAHGQKCALVRRDFGKIIVRCGYVRVTDASPLFGKNYDQIAEEHGEFGDLTFSGTPVGFGADGYWVGIDDDGHDDDDGMHELIDGLARRVRKVSR